MYPHAGKVFSLNVTVGSREPAAPYGMNCQQKLLMGDFTKVTQKRRLAVYGADRGT